MVLRADRTGAHRVAFDKNRKILIYYLLILFFKSENIFKETMGA